MAVIQLFGHHHFFPKSEAAGNQSHELTLGMESRDPDMGCKYINCHLRLNAYAFDFLVTIKGHVQP